MGPLPESIKPSAARGAAQIAKFICDSPGSSSCLDRIGSVDLSNMRAKVAFDVTDNFHSMPGEAVKRIRDDRVESQPPGIMTRLPIDEGGTSGARFASLIGTCKMHGDEPYAYPRRHAGLAARPRPSVQVP
jgi:hypothetical protein